MTRGFVPGSLVVLALVGACRGGGGSPPSAEEARVDSRRALLSAVGVCALGTFARFEEAAAALETETASLVAAGADAAGPALARSQDAFRRAMSRWQVAELMRFGPLAPRSMPGGQDLRDAIYSWPLVSRCAVEEQLVSLGYTKPEFGSALVNRRGLGALEYLLFFRGADSACPSGSPTQVGMATMAPSELDARRRAYASTAAALLRERAQALVRAWRRGEGDFITTLERAGQGDGSLFRSTQAALNAVSDALFYVDRELKDLKLAGPAGLKGCEAERCPELLESPFAQLELENLSSNLEGLRAIALGCDEGEGVGFDDLLVSLQADGVAARLRERIADMQRALDAIEEAELRVALQADLASVRALHAATKGFTDLLKTEFLGVLDLELPVTLEGDND